jgi:hypothetical protein
MTKEAEKLHELITSSYQALEEDRKQSATGRSEQPPDIAAENRPPVDRRRRRLSRGDRGLLRSWWELHRIAGAALALAALMLLVLVVVALGLSRDDAGSPSSENATELDREGPATPEPESVDAEAAGPEFIDADGSTSLTGTWTMYWRNAADTDSAAFTLRFNGVNGGTVEVLNDETESDTWIELEGDELRFGFTRTFQAPASWPPGSPFPAEGWDETSEFRGTRVSEGQFLGTWYRDDWECRPDLTPPCSTKPDPRLFTAWIEQEP